MADKAEGEVLCFAGVTLDLGRGSLRNAAGTEVPLAPKPFDLLRTLAREAGRIVTKDALLDAVWPGVHVAEDSLFQAVREARRAIGDEEGRVLRSVPRRGYMLDTVVTAAPPASMPLAPPEDRASLVVLPFANISGDPEQEYFADGMVEEITAALGRIRSFFVIARNSAFTYKGRAVDVREVGRDLGVRYVLDGSVRKAGGRVRITCQLAETETGRQLWSERFDAALDDVFELQDRVTEAVAGALEPNLEAAELRRSTAKPTQDLSAHDYYLRGMAAFHEGTLEGFVAAGALFERATELDPGYGVAYGMAAFCLALRRSSAELGSADVAKGRRLAELAAKTGRDDAAALASAAFALCYLCMDPEGGAALAEAACQINPNSSQAWSSAGLAHVLLGHAELAITDIHHALRLNPRDRQRYVHFVFLATAFCQAGRFDDAIAAAERAVQEQPQFPNCFRTLAVAYAFAGRVEEARRAMAEMLRLAPTATLSRISAFFLPYRNLEFAARVKEAYRRAGMPE
ncbi:winged helix-turn-helix domain-containing protein [Roseomonas sp. SSH11]|uniref:Winged helix-turn-helix domain-containing protein n=1 Tax=Pararoseomonas baculiformis TaxID=2820812 RepID=A0ABS4ALB3_9PROT|nr:winged helix-turn-helix domain-containing protein [Pararoseomonas baculiformis]MBP0447812.1 winged helix-turn-helix domain-containing protein [Pararoseomonas baculiformis]